MTTPADGVSSTTLEEFVESAAILLEDMGLTRMAGRMLGRLLICDPPQQSATQLTASLSASTGSISGTTRLLIRYGLIERIAFPGDRRDYFRLRPESWWQLMSQRLLSVQAFRALIESGREVVKAPEPTRRLEEMGEFWRFVEEALEDGLARWEASREKRARR